MEPMCHLKQASVKCRANKWRDGQSDDREPSHECHLPNVVSPINIMQSAQRGYGQQSMNN